MNTMAEVKTLPTNMETVEPTGASYSSPPSSSPLMTPVACSPSSASSTVSVSSSSSSSEHHHDGQQLISSRANHDATHPRAQNGVPHSGENVKVDKTNDMPQQSKPPKKAKKKAFRRNSSKRIDVESDKLIGRDKEVRLLQHAIDRLFHEKGNNSDNNDLDNAHDERSIQHSAITAHRTVAIISGEAGNGKSSLAMHFKQQCLARFGFFVSCKFNLQQTEEPFAGIKMAMAQLFEQIMDLAHPTHTATATSATEDTKQDPRSFEQLKQIFATELAVGEVRVLSEIVPGIAKLLQSNKMTAAHKTTSPNGRFKEESTDQTPTTERATLKGQSDGLKFTLRRFVRIICDFAPLVIVLDDMEWADSTSLDLILSWVMDVHNTSLMAIGCHRSDLVDQKHTVNKMLQHLEESKRDRRIRMLRVEIGALPVNGVRELITSALRKLSEAFGRWDGQGTMHDANETAESLRMDNLARIVHSKTRGNIFCVKQYLHSLLQNDLITYNADLLTPEWTWDPALVQSEFPDASSILELMNHKIRQSQAACHILPIAACLGMTFSQSVIAIIIRTLAIHSGHSKFYQSLEEVGMSSHQCTDGNIRRMIRSCVKNGFLAHADASMMPKGCPNFPWNKNANHGRPLSDLYTFVQSKVHEAAIRIVPDDKIDEFHFHIGESLLLALTKAELEDKMFNVASLLSKKLDLVPSITNGINSRMRIINLYYGAGMKAVGCCAFHQALTYFRDAIKLLPPEHWSTHSDLSLDIYSSAAECALHTVSTEEMRTYCATIIKQECHMLHKVRAYRVLIDACSAATTGNEGNSAVEWCLEVLKGLGCNVPAPNAFNTTKALLGNIAIRRKSRTWTDSTFEKLPLVSDPTELAIARMLARLVVACYFSRRELLPSVLLMAVRKVLRVGITPHSSIAIGFQGLTLGSLLNDPQSRLKFGEIALEIVERTGGTTVTDTQTMLLVYSGILHWNSPMELMKEPLMHTYRVSMATGDAESALWALSVHGHVRLMTGSSLESLDKELSTSTKLMKDFRKPHLQIASSAYWQAVLNLRGSSRATTELVGDAFNENEASTEPATQDDAMLVQDVGNSKILLAVFYGEFETGARVMYETYRSILHQVPGVPITVLVMFLGGLCCQIAGNTHNPQSKAYRRLAHQCHKKLKQWKKNGTRNCDHYLLILSAEKNAMNGRRDDAIRDYHQAIEEASKRNYIQDQALASERLGRFLCKIGMVQNGQNYMDKAYSLYSTWGAAGKVDMLRSDPTFKLSLIHQQASESDSNGEA